MISKKIDKTLLHTEYYIYVLEKFKLISVKNIYIHLITNITAAALYICSKINLNRCFIKHDKIWESKIHNVCGCYHFKCVTLEKLQYLPFHLQLNNNVMININWYNKYKKSNRKKIQFLHIILYKKFALKIGVINIKNENRKTLLSTNLKINKYKIWSNSYKD